MQKKFTQQLAARGRPSEDKHQYCTAHNSLTDKVLKSIIAREQRQIEPISETVAERGAKGHWTARWGARNMGVLNLNHYNRKKEQATISMCSLSWGVSVQKYLCVLSQISMENSNKHTEIYYTRNIKNLGWNTLLKCLNTTCAYCEEVIMDCSSSARKFIMNGMCSLTGF